MGRMISPPICVLAMAVNSRGTFTPTVCMNCCVTLRQIFIMPRVAINAGILLRATRKPLIKPIRHPMASAAAIPMMKAGTPVTPIEVSRPLALLLIRIIITAPTATSVEPTARSIPPEMITKAMPKATMPTEALLRRILIQFLLQLVNHALKLG